MYSLIFSLAFVFVAFIAMLIGALKARKKVWQFSIVRLVRIIVSATLGAALSSMISWYIFDALISAVDLGEIGRLMNDIPAVRESVTAILAMIIAPIIFLPIYILLRNILKIFSKMLTRLLIKVTTKKPEEKKDASAVENESEPCVDENVSEPCTAENESEPCAAENANEICAEASVAVENDKASEKKAKKAKKKNEFRLEKSSWISALCGAACGLFALCIIAVPMIGTLGITDDMLSMTIHSLAESEHDENIEMVADIFDASAHNAGAVTVKMLGGDFLYDLMTTHKVGGHATSLRHEAKAIKVVADAFASVSNESPADKASRIRQIPEVFGTSNIFPLVLSEVTCSATGAWEAGRDFYGISKPDVSEDYEDLVMALLDSFSHSDVNSVKEDVYTVCDIIAILVESDALEDADGDLWNLLAEEQVMSGVFYDILENDRLSVLLDEFFDFGMTTFLKAMSVPEDTESLYDRFIVDINNVYGLTEEELASEYEIIFDKYGLRVDEEIALKAAKRRMQGGDVLSYVEANVVANKKEFTQKTELVSIKDIVGEKNKVTDNKKEAAAMAHAFALMEGITTISNDVVNGIRLSGPMLDAFAKTQTIGENSTHLLLTAIFQSDMICSNIGLRVLDATGAANDMAEGAELRGYEAVMISFEKMVEVLEAASDETKDTREPVKELLKDLTPDSAKTISNISTPGVIKNYGVNDKSSKPAADLISDVFTNLSNSKEEGMSDEEYEKEAAAVSDTMNMLMSANKDAENVFGENSKTGLSATEFVNNLLDSSVTRQTLVDTVYADGDEPIVDPLYIEADMNDDERAEFITSLNDKYQGTDKTEEDMKSVIAIASLINVEILIVDGQVVDARAN